MLHLEFFLEKDSTPSHRSNLIQNFLKEKLCSKFIKHTEWLPSSPDCNPLLSILEQN